MQKEVFDRLVEGIKQLGVRRIRVIGNGEPTLHPDFALFTKQLAKAAPYLSVLTNGQWRRPKDIIHALLQAPVSMIEFSVDAATKDGYEKSRLGGSFERIIENLKLLKETKRRVGSRAIINLRIMMRPSERAVERQLRAFWQNFAAP